MVTTRKLIYSVSEKSGPPNGGTENASTEDASTGGWNTQVRKTQVRVCSVGKRKYGKRRYESAGVENASTNTYLSAETIIQLASVIKLIFYSTQRHPKSEQAVKSGKKSELFHS